MDTVTRADRVSYLEGQLYLIEAAITTLYQGANPESMEEEAEMLQKALQDVADTRSHLLYLLHEVYPNS